MFFPSLIGAFGASEPSFADRTTFLMWAIATFAFYFLAKLFIASPYFAWADATAELDKVKAGRSKREALIDCIYELQTEYHEDDKSEYERFSKRAWSLLAATHDPIAARERLENFIGVVRGDPEMRSSPSVAKDFVDWIRSNA